MNMVDIILKKRNGNVLTEGEINFLIESYVEGKTPDYQMSALLMAIYFKGLTESEIFSLTGAMRDSGTRIDLSDIPGVKIDKHSSGGVGDKISIISGPIAAAAGVKVAKMSGRGLGFTGGTIDKLESIKGFDTNISIKKFKDVVKNVGMSIIGQSEDVAKADKMIYALRDVTGTVDIKGLIASSIMSKKLALGNDGILLDVKYGKGALMKNYEEAESLAQLMERIGEHFGKKTESVLSPMEEPLGNNIGNACEIIEAIETLKGDGPEDLTTLSLEIAAKMMVMGGKAKTVEEGKAIGKKLIANKMALMKMKEFIEAQGADGQVIYDYSLLPQPKHNRILKGKDLKKYGKIKQIDASIIGKASLICGAGRRDKNEKIDLSAGITLLKKTGDSVSCDDVLAEIYGNNQQKLDEAFEILKIAFDF